MIVKRHIVEIIRIVIIIVITVQKSIILTFKFFVGCILRDLAMNEHKIRIITAFFDFGYLGKLNEERPHFKKIVNIDKFGLGF